MAASCSPTQVFFSYAFRPFFLLVSVYAVLAIGGWALNQWGLWSWPDSMPAYIRHGHEMLFGYAGGAIAGFLLTAVATWTSRPAVSAEPLLGLCIVWITARIGAFIPTPTGFAFWSVASLLFWVALAGLIAREVLAARNIRNYKVLPLSAAFLGAEIAFFSAASEDPERLEMCLRTGLFLVIGMIFLVGGRIIPAFTQNWLRLNRTEINVQLPAFGLFDLASVLIATAFAVAFIVWPTSIWTGTLGLLAALLHAWRLLRWRGWLAGREPLLWVLHMGYGWIPVGFGLLGLSCLGWQSFFDAGIHALTYGAMGTLILGVAARVALGHTGRALQAYPAMTFAFGLITLGTLLRLFGALGQGLITLSVLLWMASYLIFLVQYAPILLGPRVST
ncbi:NnrS family protein [Methyloterricola oryzae]|uniref:NnrS family protein n=1 Tax=Methyloterricola oryzae TaxID=1495050 RepID=UPI0005EBE6C4|nr:NnrS family protein [Methyloterricola oryzae]